MKNYTLQITLEREQLFRAFKQIFNIPMEIFQDIDELAENREKLASKLTDEDIHNTVVQNILEQNDLSIGMKLDILKSIITEIHELIDMLTEHLKDHINKEEYQIMIDCLHGVRDEVHCIA